MQSSAPLCHYRPRHRVSPSKLIGQDSLNYLPQMGEWQQMFHGAIQQPIASRMDYVYAAQNTPARELEIRERNFGRGSIVA